MSPEERQAAEEMREQGAREDRKTLAAAGYIDRADREARRKRPDAPTYKSGTYTELRAAAERVIVEREKP